MRARFSGGSRDGAEEEIQTSNGFAPQLYQLPSFTVNKDALPGVSEIAYYDLQEVKEGVAYYKYRCTA